MSAAEALQEPRGRFVEVAGGRRLRVVAEGPPTSTRPLVVLEAGSFGFSADWAAVQSRLAAQGLRSLAYDRAGLGLSDPGPAPRDSAAIVDDLEALLAAEDETGPLIVCGHSMAGMHVRLFASRNTPLVRGLVLVDAVTPEAMDHAWAASYVGPFTTLSHLAAWGASVGLQRPLAGALGDAIGLPPLAKAEKRRAFADPVHNHWAAAEVDAWADDARQARAAGDLNPSWPTAVVLTGDGRQSSPRRAVQAAPATGARDGFVIHVPRANHASLLGERHAGHLVRAILSVEAAAAKSC
ncbi:MAG TPA: alpha/beta fold hydrolase [Caulobacteraceae bacterium]|nr:alpha/beta fold hydrolase [Caulobacteraceae bacterium]